MKIIFDAQSGLYFAFSEANGSPCLGFSKSRRKAMNFCFELLLEADTGSDTSSQQGRKHNENNKR